VDLQRQRPATQIAQETHEDFGRAWSWRRAESGVSWFEAADGGAFITLVQEDDSSR